MYTQKSEHKLINSKKSKTPAWLVLRQASAVVAAKPSYKTHYIFSGLWGSFDLCCVCRATNWSWSIMNSSAMYLVSLNDVSDIIPSRLLACVNAGLSLFPCSAALYRRIRGPALETDSFAACEEVERRVGDGGVLKFGEWRWCLNEVWG